LAEATGKKKSAPKPVKARGEEETSVEKKPRKKKAPRKPENALEKAIAKGKELKKKGLQVAQGVHDGLGKVHGWIGKGIETADKVQHGLEQASKLAKAGAGL